MEPKFVHGLKVIEAEPGGPLPPGVPSWAEPCELVEIPDLSPALKPWVVGLGAAGVAVGAIMTAFFTFMGIPLVLLSLMILFHGLVPGTKTLVTPSPGGRYLAFEADADEAKREAPFDSRIVFRVAGVMMTAEVARSFGEHGQWAWLLVASVVGLGLLYFSSRRDEWDVSGAAASLRFRALADPARPLTPEDLGHSAADASRRAEPLRDVSAPAPERVAEPRA